MSLILLFLDRNLTRDENVPDAKGFGGKHNGWINSVVILRNYVIFLVFDHVRIHWYYHFNFVSTVNEFSPRIKGTTLI